MSTSCTTANNLVRQVSQNFRRAAAIPQIQKLRLADQQDVIHCVLEQASLAREEQLSFLQILPLKSLQAGESKSQMCYPQVFPLAKDSLQESLGSFSIQIVKHQAEGAKEPSDILNVFRDGRLIASHNLALLDVHGAVYFDKTFGGITISPTLDKIAYIAEKKKSKNKPFLHPHPSDEGKDMKDTTMGQEFAYKDEFGEQLVGKSDPVIVLMKLTNDGYEADFEVLAEDVFQEKGLRPGLLVFADGSLLYGIASKVTPQVLGAIYCENRPNVLFKLSLEDQNLEILSSSTCSVTHPRVSQKQGRLLWLERDLSQNGNYPGPHMACQRLMMRSLDGGENRVIVPVCDKYDPSFAGIYMQLIPKRPFSDSGRYFFFSTCVNHTQYPVMVDTEENTFRVLKDCPNLVIDDVHRNKILAIYSTTTCPPHVAVAQLLEDKGETTSFVHYDLLSTTAKYESDAIFHAFEDIMPAQGHPDARFEGIGFNAFYVGPRSGDNVPLIVWPHGGPHAVITSSFMEKFYFFTLCGFGILLVNYRGSLGRGQESVNSLLGHCGDTDVKDCYQATRECLDKYSHLSRKNVFLFGGSHGGFLVTHLAGQYPDVYKAVVARNPVTNIATMSTVTDIPDWCMNEAGFAFEYKSPRPVELKKMYESSPIAHAEKVKAAVLLLIGKKDLRVPHSQGFEYYHNLKALNKASVSMNVYDDNHPLAKVKNDINVFISTALFFMKHAANA